MLGRGGRVVPGESSGLIPFKVPIPWNILPEPDTCLCFKPLCKATNWPWLASVQQRHSTGFCAEHDLHLFREVDFDNSRSFDPASPRQVVLPALRAAVCEYWLKLNNQKLYQRLVELGDREDYESLRKMLNLENADAVRLTLTWEEKWKPSLLGTKVSLRRIQRLFRSLYQQVTKRCPIRMCLTFPSFGDGKSNCVQATA